MSYSDDEVDDDFLGVLKDHERVVWDLQDLDEKPGGRDCPAF